MVGNNYERWNYSVELLSLGNLFGRHYYIPLRFHGLLNTTVTVNPRVVAIGPYLVLALEF